ncbi:MAG: LysM domain-containing protein [Sphingomonas sp.]
MTVVRWKFAVAGLGALGLAACAGKSPHIKSLPSAPVEATASDTGAVFDLLMQGNEGEARKKLKVILKREPMNATAQLLNDSVERDPKVLLGPQSYPYTVEAGDTVISLAQRFLGNRMKAYQLLRYNDLKAPATLVAGQTLRIPGEPARVEPVRRPEPVAARPTSPAPVSATPKAKPAAPKPSVSAANPAAARQARAAGLAALNQGNVNRAVGLLRHAATLDPANPVIARDLVRAERIAATVKARK